MSFQWCLKSAGAIAIGGLLTVAEVPAQQQTIAETVSTRSIQPVSKADRQAHVETPPALSLPSVKQLTLLDKAYLDAFSILRVENPCSMFFGGPSAIEVLNQLKQQLNPTYLDGHVAVRMTGKKTVLTSLLYLISYRLFQNVDVNLNGPFYRGNELHSCTTVPRIGSFLPNTREARVTILLHELGHLIEGPDKNWLLPNDGASAYLSEENTERVIAVCGKQIRSRSPISFGQELQTARLVHNQ